MIVAELISVSIEFFFKYFKQKIREEIEKYDCENEALLKKLSS